MAVPSSNMTQCWRIVNSTSDYILLNVFYNVVHCDISLNEALIYRKVISQKCVVAIATVGAEFNLWVFMCRETEMVKEHEEVRRVLLQKISLQSQQDECNETRSVSSLLQGHNCEKSTFQITVIRNNSNQSCQKTDFPPVKFFKSTKCMPSVPP